MKPRFQGYLPNVEPIPALLLIRPMTAMATALKDRPHVSHEIRCRPRGGTDYRQPCEKSDCQAALHELVSITRLISAAAALMDEAIEAKFTFGIRRERGETHTAANSGS